MKPTIVVILLLTSFVFAETKPIDLDEIQLHPQAHRDQQILRLESNRPESATTMSFFELENPGITQDSYALAGQVRYQDLTDSSYLEMWNHLPAKPGGTTITASFFSRTLGQSGPMAKLTGSSEWRDFRLPAFIDDNSQRRPLKLSFNAHFSEGGAIEVRGLHLIDGLGPIPSATGSTRQFTVFGIGFICAGVVIVGWRLISRKHRQAELRRIQATDV